MKKMSLKFFLVLFSFAFFDALSYAQEREPASEHGQGTAHEPVEQNHEPSELPERLRAGTVVLQNDTNYDITYNVSVDNLDWSPYVIKARYLVTYQQSFYILIKISEQKCANYLLEVNKKYHICWSDNKAMWDVYIDP